MLKYIKLPTVDQTMQEKPLNYIPKQSNA